MGLTARNTGGGNFTPAPPGAHLARCCWVIDLGTQSGGKFGAKHQVLLGWELPHELIAEGDRAGEPYFVSKRYTLSLHEKSTLRQHLEAWRAREFTEKELDGFDLRNVLDKPCTLTVTHSKRDDGGMRAQVAGVAPPMKGMQCPDRVNDTRVFDLEKPDDRAFAALPEWVQKVINGSDERSGRRTSVDDEPPPPGDDDVVTDELEPCPF